MEVEAIEDQVFLERRRLRRVGAEVLQFGFDSGDSGGIPGKRPFAVGGNLGHTGRDQLVADDGAVFVDRIATGVVPVLVGVDEVGEVRAPELAGDGVSQLGVDFRDAKGVNNDDALFGGEGKGRGRGDVVAEPETDHPVIELFDVQRQPRDFLCACPRDRKQQRQHDGHPESGLHRFLLHLAVAGRAGGFKTWLNAAKASWITLFIR